MNWTGGNLQRHSRGRSNAVSQRQKAHFAKVRTRLDGSTVAGSDQYIVTLHDDQPNGNLDKIERTRSHGRHFSASERENRQRVSHRSSGVRVTSLRLAELSQSATPTVEKGQSFERNYESVKGERRHNLIESQKQELLNRRDWLGLTPATPLRMRIATSMGHQVIGKKRKTTGNGHAALQLLDYELSPVEKLDRPADLKRFRSETLSETDIDIRIGSQALVSENDVFSTANTPQHPPIGRHSPDSMLLELERSCDGVDIVWDNTNSRTPYHDRRAPAENSHHPYAQSDHPEAPVSPLTQTLRTEDVNSSCIRPMSCLPDIEKPVSNQLGSTADLDVEDTPHSVEIGGRESRSNFWLARHGVTEMRSFRTEAETQHNGTRESSVDLLHEDGRRDLESLPVNEAASQPRVTLDEHTVTHFKDNLWKKFVFGADEISPSSEDSLRAERHDYSVRALGSNEA